MLPFLKGRTLSRIELQLVVTKLKDSTSSDPGAVEAFTFTPETSNSYSFPADRPVISIR